MRRLCKYLKNVWTTWQFGDPLLNLVNTCQSRYFFSKPINELHLTYFDGQRRFINWLFILLMIISAFRFSLLMSQQFNEGQEILVGSVQGFLGFSGKAMYLVWVFMSLESGLVRLAMIVKENSCSFSYLSLQICGTLDNDPNFARTKKLLQMKFFAMKKVLLKLLLAITSWHVITTVMRVRNEDSWTRIVVWIAWSIFNYVLSLNAVIDYVELPLLRSMSGMTQVTRLLAVEEESQKLLKSTDLQTTQLHFRTLITQYNDVQTLMNHSRKSAGLFMFPRNVCSTVINGALVFGLIHLKDESLLLIIMGSITYITMNQVWVVMTGSAKMTQFSHRLYETLAILPHHACYSFLSRNDKRIVQQIVKCLGSSRPPIALTGAEGKIYNSMAVFENITSTILMVIQFRQLTGATKKAWRYS